MRLILVGRGGLTKINQNEMIKGYHLILVES